MITPSLWKAKTLGLLQGRKMSQIFDKFFSHPDYTVGAGISPARQPKGCS
jgi:hypothetical protein